MKSKLSFKQTMLAGLMAAAVSAVINAAIFLIFHSTGIISDNIFVQPDQPLTIVPVIISSIFPTIIATLVFFLFEKVTKNGFKIFAIVSIILILLSLAMPFTGIPNVTVAYAMVLDVMHLVVPLSLLYFLSRSKKKNV